MFQVYGTHSNTQNIVVERVVLYFLTFLPFWFLIGVAIYCLSLPSSHSLFWEQHPDCYYIITPPQILAYAIQAGWHCSHLHPWQVPGMRTHLIWTIGRVHPIEPNVWFRWHVTSRWWLRPRLLRWRTFTGTIKEEKLFTLKLLSGRIVILAILTIHTMARSCSNEVKTKESHAKRW